ncbi:cache domain-containing protein [bacterium]|nr:cache domain-containing protein [bacterium]
MKKLIGLLAIIILTSSTGQARYNPKYDRYITKENLVGFVKEAVYYAKIYGKKAALDEYKDKNGLFVRGELYIYAYDQKCRVLSHGANPDLIGKDLSMLEDSRGTLFIKEMVKQIDHKGKGWLKFFWFHPATKRITPKLGYFEKVDNTWWIGSGIYLDQIDE